MQQTISQFFEQWGDVILVIVLTILGINVILTSAKKALEFIKDKTESKLDDKAYEAVSKLLKVFNVVIEFLSANSSYLPTKAQQAAKEAKEKL